jgi:hypothetical protein
MAAQKIIAKGDSKIADGYELSLLSTGKISLKVNQYSSDTYKINSRTLYSIGGWVHIAGTFNGTEMKIYINGTEDKKLTFSLPTGIAMNSLPLNFGTGTDETNNFKGAIDDVRIYDYALTDIEVYNLASGSTDKINHTARQARPNLFEIKDMGESPDPGDSPIRVFPNPIESTLFVELPQGSNHTVSICDLYGRILYQTATNGDKSIYTIPLDAFHFKSGVYLISIQSPSSRIMRKFFKR